MSVQFTLSPRRLFAVVNVTNFLIIIIYNQKKNKSAVLFLCTPPSPPPAPPLTPLFPNV